MTKVNNIIKDDTELIRYYTGIGSRETPQDVCAIMVALAKALGLAGYTLRSGGADGADAAFETGACEVDAPRDIFIPWKGFNGSTSTLIGASPEALAMAKSVHPRWFLLEARVKAGKSKAPMIMHGRNCYQVLGLTLDVPTSFVLCWTPDGCEDESTRSKATGGTATAIALASRKKIGVINLKNNASRIRFNELLVQHNIDYQIPIPVERQISNQAQTSLF